MIGSKLSTHGSKLPTTRYARISPQFMHLYTSMSTMPLESVSPSRKINGVKYSSLGTKFPPSYSCAQWSCPSWKINGVKYSSLGKVSPFLLLRIGLLCRGREGERVYVCERGRESVCVREGECVCVWERERERERERVFNVVGTIPRDLKDLADKSWTHES